MIQRAIAALCSFAGINTPDETQQLIDGLRRDLETAMRLLGQSAQQGNQLAKSVANQDAVIRGILLTHKAYEDASKPLMQAKRRLNAKMERERKRQEKAMLAAEAQAKSELLESGAIAGDITPPNPGGDATAADDQPVSA